MNTQLRTSDRKHADPLPITVNKGFDPEQEATKRLSVLAALYHQRRINEDSPNLALRDLEAQLESDRGGLDFALWYLRGKGYIVRDDSCECGISVAGVDYLEQEALQNEVAARLLSHEESSLRQTGSSPKSDCLTAEVSHKAA